MDGMLTVASSEFVVEGGAMTEVTFEKVSAPVEVRVMLQRAVVGLALGRMSHYADGSKRYLKEEKLQRLLKLLMELQF